MAITHIDLGKNRSLFKTCVHELSTIVNAHTVKAGSYKDEGYTERPFNSTLTFDYGPYDIIFENVENATLKIEIVGDFSTALNLQETRNAYDDLLAHAASFLKKEGMNTFISLSFYRFSENGIDLNEYFGPYNFADFEVIRKATPLSEELKNLQEATLELTKFFPIKHNGKVIETGGEKFRKMYHFDIINEEGVAKIGVFHGDLLLTLATKKEILDLVTLKKSKLDELQKIKDTAIATLRSHDASLQYDGKNGVVLFGEKATINTEYDVFKNEYLMVFLKSKVKAPTIKKMQEKIDKLMLKKTIKKAAH